MDLCAPPGLLPPGDALQLMQAAVTPIVDIETIALADGLDRILAEPVYSPINVPGYDNSAMDGYALRMQDAGEKVQLKLVGQSLAGHPFTGKLGAGECVRITTGAVIPTGADTVIMQEQVMVTEGLVNLQTSPRAGDHIRRAGEDIAQGSLVLPEGRRLSPIDIGLLASLGIATLSVKRMLRVAVFSTGDELTPLGEPLKPGCIYDSNRHALMALLRRAGVQVVDLGLVQDHPEAIEQVFIEAINSADLVISTGGVSVGDADYTKPVLDKLGQVHFWKIAMKPGKPFAFGKLGKGWFFGLPGNPVSAVVTFHQLVLPTLRILGGETYTAPETITAITANPLKKQPGRIDFQRGKLFIKDGIQQVESTGMQSSGMLSSMAQANCYIVLEQERGAIEAGEAVQVLPFDRFVQ